MNRLLALKYLATGLLLALFFMGCRKKDPTDDKGSDVDNSLIFKSFKLEKRLNTPLSTDMVFSQFENTLTGSNLLRYHFSVVPTFETNAETVEINGQKQVSGVNRLDLRQPIVYTLTSAAGKKRQIALNVNWDNNLVQVNIQTQGNAPINSLTTYVKGSINIDGKKVYDDFAGTLQIRGRGNSTWTFPKKPYRFKLDADAGLLGLKPEKDWVLLANYLDGLHMLNAVALKMGQMLNMPFTNSFIPVELNLNGQYQGLYLLTEQIEVKTNRVNVGKEGLLFQLDRNFDEPYQFKSAGFQLPVMIKDPELTDQAQILPLKTQFDQMEALVNSSNFPNTNYLDFFDGDAFANYLLVNLLTDNQEPNHPKSTYIYKTKTGKYTMGPIWDFDWAYSFEGTNTYFGNATRRFFWSSPSTGTRFFSKIAADPKMKVLLKQKWGDFRANKFNDLLAFIDNYAFLIEGARNRDYEKWKRGNANFRTDLAALKTWLQARANFLNTYIDTL
jgi:hypothetical protein